jgi:hypothetical protein
VSPLPPPPDAPLSPLTGVPAPEPEPPPEREPGSGLPELPHAAMASAKQVVITARDAARGLRRSRGVLRIAGLPFLARLTIFVFFRSLESSGEFAIGADDATGNRYSLLIHVSIMAA